MLKTTFVTEYLHYLGPLHPVLDRSKEWKGKSTAGVLQAMENGLGRKLHEFEAEWREWMRGKRRPGSSILGRLAAAAGSSR